MHGTTDPEALNDGTLTRREYPPIPRQPRVPVKRWTVRSIVNARATLREARTAIAALTKYGRTG